MATSILKSWWLLPKLGGYTPCWKGAFYECHDPEKNTISVALKLALI